MKKNKIQILILLILALFVPKIYSLELHEFVYHYKKRDPLLKISEVELDSVFQNKIIANDLNQSSLLLGPTKGTSRYTVLNNELEDSSSRFDLKWSQALAYGTNFKLSSTKYYEPSNSSFSSLDKELKFEVSQELWKNSFGKADRTLALASEIQVEEYQSRFQLQKINTCKRAIEEYSNLYYQINRNILLDEILKGANEAHSLAKSQFKNSLIRKIDYLSAQADQLKFEGNSAKAHSELDQLLNDLRITIGDHDFKIKLQSPLEVLSAWKLTNLDQDYKNAYEVLILEKLVESKKLELEAAYLTNRASVKLGLEGRTRTGRESSDDGIVDYDEDFFGVNLLFDWPIWNKSMNANEALVKNQLESAQEKLKLAKYDYEKSVLKMIENKKLFEKLLLLGKSKKEIYQNQVKEAYRILRAGKIEFESYLRIRDQFLEESVQYLELEKSTTTTLLNLASYSQNPQIICLEKK